MLFRAFLRCVTLSYTRYLARFARQVLINTPTLTLFSHLDLLGRPTISYQSRNPRCMDTSWQHFICSSCAFVLTEVFNIMHTVVAVSTSNPLVSAVIFFLRRG